MVRLRLPALVPRSTRHVAGRQATAITTPTSYRTGGAARGCDTLKIMSPTSAFEYPEGIATSHCALTTPPHQQRLSQNSAGVHQRLRTSVPRILNGSRT